MLRDGLVDGPIAGVRWVVRRGSGVVRESFVRPLQHECRVWLAGSAVARKFIIFAAQARNFADLTLLITRDPNAELFSNLAVLLLHRQC